MKNGCLKSATVFRFLADYFPKINFHNPLNKYVIKFTPFFMYTRCLVKTTAKNIKRTRKRNKVNDFENNAHFLWMGWVAID